MPELEVGPIVAELDRVGFCVVAGVVSRDQLRAMKAELREVLDATPTGRNDFEGFATRRIYRLFAKTRAFDEWAIHPVVLGVAEQVLGPCQLSAPTGIEIGPGEPAQVLHRDDQVYPLPNPHADVVLNTIWALDDFTIENGATRIVAGSHRWERDRRPGPDDSIVDVVMPAGSVAFYLGSVLHGGGANGTSTPRLGVIL
jgi:ectoine hydroxylase-related dioxygenase (phytanoyl-CoA dioxygenase family)